VSIRLRDFRRTEKKKISKQFHLSCHDQELQYLSDGARHL
jgi:hypothetical protein